jgi:hypothetical protein
VNKNNLHLRKWRQNLLVHTALRLDSNHHREFTLISCKPLDVGPRWRPQSAQSDNENLSASPRGLSPENDIPMDMNDEEPQYTGADPNHNMPEDNPIPSPRHSQRAYVEDAEDDEQSNHSALVGKNADKEAGAPKGHQATSFEKYSKRQKDNNEPPWVLFESDHEWELAKWLMESGASQNKVDSF